MTAFYINDLTRAFITVSGDDRYEFLQGLISNDIEKCREGHAIWAALLTPQGKFLYDFFVFPQQETLVIDCHKDEMMPLGQLLRKYQLRSDIQLGIDQSLSCVLLMEDWGFKGDGCVLPAEGGVVYSDPRNSQLGYRFVGNSDAFLKYHQSIDEKPKEVYEAVRIEAGIPDGSQDIEKNKGLLLEYGFDELNGVDWNKGCYMGQELTARTKYRALIKKRLMIIKPVSGAMSNMVRSGEMIRAGDKDIGHVRSVSENTALAFIRLDRMEKAQNDQMPFMVGEAEVLIEYPGWIKEENSTSV
ncbi:YgfZ/GcvT domain-containing protein [Curvivirga sp.]|uniref:CAF17-like 4Fe-4S cluster assembly/insertion protein YgfZ n=1 Tax=Curvivirga sp. TaxID=2856848 RepID=UPI003B5B1203